MNFLIPDDMPNKLTDTEIKKALKEYIEFADFEYTEYTSIRLDILKNALDLINSLEGEKEKNENIIRIADKTIESLKAEVERLNNNISAMSTTLSNSARATRHEAYKECIEKVKAHYKECQFEYDYSNTCETLNNIYKELVGDDNFANIDKQN